MKQSSCPYSIQFIQNHTEVQAIWVLKSKTSSLLTDRAMFPKLCHRGIKDAASFSLHYLRFFLLPAWPLCMAGDHAHIFFFLLGNLRCSSISSPFSRKIISFSISLWWNWLSYELHSRRMKPSGLTLGLQAGTQLGSSFTPSSLRSLYQYIQYLSGSAWTQAYTVSGGFWCEREWGLWTSQFRTASHYQKHWSWDYFKKPKKCLQLN